jgi:hypothetical protein
MMNFRKVKTALITLIGNAGSGLWRTIGFQQQGQRAEEILDARRSVQVFYSKGDFPKSGGSLSGPTLHDMTFRLELSVAKTAKGDIATINNPSATAPQLAAAIANFQESAALADESFDELVDLIYQTLMSAENIDLGMTSPELPPVDRWIGTVEKDQPLERGELVVLTGEMLFTCKIEEPVTGVAPTASESIDTTVESYQDEEGDPDGGKAGVIVENT